MTTISKHGTLHRLIVGGLVAASAAVPLALATMPAEAATSSGCTATPLKHVFAGFNSSGVKEVRYSVSVTCSGDRSITVEQRRYDAVPSPDKYLGQSVLKHSFDKSGSVRISVTRALPETGPGNERMYQKIRFRVASHGVTSSWTSWQASPVLSIPN